MIKTILQDPSISDDILFTLTTTDANGNLTNPVTVDSVSLYFIQISFFDPNLRTNIVVEQEGDYTTYFKQALPTANFGVPDFPAWDVSNTANSALVQITEDADSNPVYGTFNLTWQPNMGEGDYFICWTWTLSTGYQSSSYYQFFVNGDTKATTSIPTHYTAPGKYEHLLERYMPDFIKTAWSPSDITPEVIGKYNKAVAKFFASIEDLVNQTPDLIDANVTPQNILPYLARLFNIKLASQDPILWRKQIKQAVPLYKQKGTLAGLTTALSNAGITLNSFNMLWQVVSQSTWQEGILVTEDSQTIFTLEKLAILPVDGLNFTIAIRPVNTNSYMSLDLTDYATFSNSSGTTTMTWIGEHAFTPIILAEGDFLDVIYKIAPVSDQSIENYIRTLPLADTRDETLVTYPLKNWNVRLIQENDSFFDVICSVKFPFVDPLVFGQIRTEFAYSENIFNMDEYNGSIRDSTDPCSIDKLFLDTCTACRSSKFNIDVTIDELSDDRIQEASDIIRIYKPFHLVINNLTYSGGFSEVMIPPMETINFYVQFMPYDFTLTGGQGIFNRGLMLSGGADSSFNAPLRDSLATPSTVVGPVSGTGYNQSYVLYAPSIRFDRLGVNNSNNLLEILNGTSAGDYTATLLANNILQVNQGSPDSLPYPLEMGQHTFRLSNIIYTESSADIYQDSLFIFSDANVSFGQYNITNTWQIVISNGSNPGTYDINEFLPNNTISINGWPGANQTGLTYQLLDNLSNVIVNGTTGQIQVVARGRLNLSDDIQDGFGVKIGYWVLYNGNQYAISGFASSSEPYIDSYSSGNVVGSANIKVLKRLVSNNLGFLNVSGMYLITNINYESGLNIMDGQNQSVDGDSDIDSNFKENYLVLINDIYYTISEWSGTNITLNGGMPVAWGFIWNIYKL